MYGKSPTKLPFVAVGGTLPLTGVQGMIMAQVALVLIMVGLILLRKAAVRRSRASS